MKNFILKDFILKNFKFLKEITIKNKKIENNEKQNFFTNKDYICGSYLNTTNPKYIEIDNIYYSHLIIVNYYIIR